MQFQAIPRGLISLVREERTSTKSTSDLEVYLEGKLGQLVKGKGEGGISGHTWIDEGQEKTDLGLTRRRNSACRLINQSVRSAEKVS